MDSSSPHPKLIGIAGGSCSGKSLIAKMLGCALPAGSAVVVGLDSYYRDLSTLAREELDNWNFDRPESLDVPLLLSQMRQLSERLVIQKPVYQFPSHTRAPESQTVVPQDYIIIEGLYTLYWQELRSMLALKVFIDVSEEVGLARRLERDQRERGFKPDYIIRQFHTTVTPMFNRYVQPTRCQADLILNGESPLRHSIDSLLRALKVHGRQ